MNINNLKDDYPKVIYYNNLEHSKIIIINIYVNNDNIITIIMCANIYCI